MTRKHFNAIAAALKATRPANIPADWRARSRFEAGAWDTWSATVIVLASTLNKSNPLFDRNRFLTACGLFSAF